jgi:hypothetical protein
MGDLMFTTPALVVLFAPTVLVPLITMLFLRTQRGRSDYGVTRWLFLLGTVVWLAVACWEAYDLGQLSLTVEQPFGLREVFQSSTYAPTMPRWMLLCLPAFPTFFAVLTMFRKRGHIR